MINVMMLTGDERAPEILIVVSVVDKLIMMHGGCISAQWPLNGTGVQLSHQRPGIIKLGFHGRDGNSYQSFYFNSDYYEVIYNFFKKYGFPMYKPTNEIREIEH